MDTKAVNFFSEMGYDYGVKPYFLVIGDVEFADFFQKAKCLGLLYIFDNPNFSKAQPTEISFLFENEVPADKFMNCLSNWVENSENNGNAVSMEFIEKKNGDYVLAISPEIKILEERLIPKHFENKVSPVFMIQVQFKEVPKGRFFELFKQKYISNAKIKISYCIGSIDEIKKRGNRSFTKNSFQFYDENDIPSSSSAIAYNSIKSTEGKASTNLPKPPRESILEIENRRKKELKTYFPITISKLQKSKWLVDIQTNLLKRYEESLIHQAICNLILFERIKISKETLTDFNKTGYPIRILDFLVNHFESFNEYTPDDSFFSHNKIELQINKDIKELENYLNK